MFRPTPRLARVKLLDMPAVKSGIAGGAGGLYMGNEVQFGSVVESLYSETLDAYRLLSGLL